MKKFTCAFLSLLLILSLALVPVYAGDATPTTVGYSADLVEEVDLSEIPDITTVEATVPTKVKISNAAGMQKLAELMNENTTGGYYLNHTFYLAKDIDMSEITDWTPIGDNTGNVLGNNAVPYFQGTFDGQGYSIKNLKVTSSAADDVNVAIFGRVYCGTIKNLVIDDSCSFTYTGTNTKARTAALVASGFVDGNNWKTIVISNVLNCASVKANNGAVGGLIAITGAWSSDSSVGYTIENCTNAGDISGTGQFWKPGQWNDTDGAVNADAYAGGLIGYMARGNITMKSCNNRGAVSAKNYAGGLMGGHYHGNETVRIESCRNSGSVIGLTAGGIMGDVQDANHDTIKNCINTGKTTSTDPESGNAAQIFGTKGGNVATENVSNIQATDTVKVLGYQKAKDVTTEGDATYRSVRLVGALNPGEEELSEFDLVGLEITVTYTKDGKTVTQNLKGSCVTVYKSLSGMDNTQDNPDPLMKEEGEYYFAVVLENIPTALENVKLSITPYFMEGTTTVYGFTAHATVSVAAAN